jgi:hypothetical protein
MLDCCEDYGISAVFMKGIIFCELNVNCLKK